jgi:hypothetical protein
MTIPSVKSPLLAHQMKVMRDHHDAVARSDADERDKADEGGNRENAARQKKREDCADQGERDVDHHLRRRAPVAERFKQ